MTTSHPPAAGRPQRRRRTRSMRSRRPPSPLPVPTPELQGVGTGNGLGGLRERIDACGGTVDAGPTADGGWRVVGRIPRRSPATV